MGASGKLGRMLCSLWQFNRFSLVPVYRSEGHGGLVWQVGGPLPMIEDVAAVIAFWGVTPRPGCNLDDNSRLALAALDLGKSMGAGVVVHCSSAAVYRPGTSPVSEADRARPVSDYGRAKLAMEKAIEESASGEGPRNIILRIGNVAGADSLFANLRPGGRITLDRFPDGSSPARSYIAPPDLVRVIEALVEDVTAEGTYNVAAPLPTEMGEIARAADCTIDWRVAPETAVPKVWLDTSRLSRILALPSGAAAADHLVKGAQAGGTWP
ncbi:NAD-dependent epimerase/dehydratase [Mameliella alba]|nr:NAD-dependent epimerase/dehydratase [Mameliella alba]OWV63582.1 NAD-dependent epimerase/dehydratase [Mameliella alba]